MQGLFYFHVSFKAALLFVKVGSVVARGHAIYQQQREIEGSVALQGDFLPLQATLRQMWMKQTCVQRAAALSHKNRNILWLTKKRHRPFVC